MLESLGKFHRHKTALLVAILAIAAFFRLFQITTVPPGLFIDEAINGNNGLVALHTGNFQVVYQENNGREGLFINIQALSLRFFGVREPWVLRIVSSVFGVLTVLGTYLLGTELLGSATGLLSALFIAISFWHINFSRMSFRAISAPFYLVFGLYLLLVLYRWLRNRKPFWKLLPLAVLGGFVFGLGFNSYLAYRVAPAIVGVVMLFELRRAWSSKTLASCLTVTSLYLTAAIAAVVPLLRYFLHNSNQVTLRTNELSIFETSYPLIRCALNAVKVAQMFFFMGDRNWRHNLCGEPELYLPIALFFLAGLCLATRVLWRSASKRQADPELEPYGLLAVWLCVSSLPAILSNDGLPHSLRSVLMIPAVFILAANGAVWVHRYAADRIAPRPLMCCTIGLLALLCVQVYTAYFIRWAGDPSTLEAFTDGDLRLSRLLNHLPAAHPPVYIVVPVSRWYAYGIPMSAQTVAFITGTYLPEQREKKDIHYVMQGHEADIPPGAIVYRLSGCQAIALPG